MSPTSLLFGSMTVATAAMLLMSGERWHSHAASRPDSLPGHGGPRIIAVIQDRDCPDALRSVERFLETARERGLPGTTVDITSERTGLAGIFLQRRLHRAILRSGLVSTPAVVLLDGDEIARFAYPLSGADSDDYREDAVEAFKSLFRIVSREVPAPRFQEEG